MQNFKDFKGGLRGLISYSWEKAKPHKLAHEDDRKLPPCSLLYNSWPRSWMLSFWVLIQSSIKPCLIVTNSLSIFLKFFLFSLAAQGYWKPEKICARNVSWPGKTFRLLSLQCKNLGNELGKTLRTIGPTIFRLWYFCVKVEDVVVVEDLTKWQELVDERNALKWKLEHANVSNFSLSVPFSIFRFTNQ